MESKRRRANVLETMNPSLNSLNDDCLLHLLKMLNLNERLIVERVCKRWVPLCKILWRQQKVLRVNRYKYSKCMSYLRCPKLEDLLTVLRRCGDHLKIVQVDGIPGVVETIGIFCPNAEHLTVVDIAVSSDEISFLATRCKNLRELHLCLCKNVTDDMLQPLLSANNNLQVLKLTVCLHVTGSFLKHVPTSVVDISVEGCGLQSEIIINSLKCFPSLLKLNLSNLPKDPLEDSVLKCIVDKVPHVEELSLINFQLLSSYFYLNQLKNLINLNLMGNQLLEDDSLKLISRGCLKLQSLNISDCENVTNEGIQYLKRLSNLKKLNIRGIHFINDGTLLCLSNIKTLTELNCKRCDLITDLGAHAILNLCENLIYFDLSWCSLITARTIHEAVKVLEQRQSNLPLILRVQWTGLKNSLPKSLPELLQILV